ncbi:hypothetical protein FRX31_010056 [Thalictrum thalictroides]|uniref:Sodium channel modifier 1 n=1 Tax=Thalictrum thalictroides TaxID=46969 RepID=A0A7J6WSK5_THATH|nr:hypothetical protein FRX31_010056 [Thalictrum thalictroides]
MGSCSFMQQSTMAFPTWTTVGTHNLCPEEEAGEEEARAITDHLSEMSVYGGDSWGREAEYRKRRVEDLILEDHLTNSSSSYKKLSNGKYTCLVCSNNPLFDTPLTLSMHNKGARHIAAESRLKERELRRQEEIQKRIALADGSIDNFASGSSIQHFNLKGKQFIAGNARSDTSKQQVNLKGKSLPLIERTVKAAAEALRSQESQQEVPDEHHNKKRKSVPFFSMSSSFIPKLIPETSQNMGSGPCLREQTRGWVTEASGKMLAEHQLEQVKRRERELKFTAAGWKRDGNGKWFRDENVEFDSDEDDPNICLS